MSSADRKGHGHRPSLHIVANVADGISWDLAMAGPAGAGVELEEDVANERVVVAKLTPIPAMESADHAAAQIRDAIVAGS